MFMKFFIMQRNEKKMNILLFYCFFVKFFLMNYITGNYNLKSGLFFSNLSYFYTKNEYNFYFCTLFSLKKRQQLTFLKE